MSEMENGKQIRLHMTKEQRLPKCFKEVEKVIRSVKACQINYKTVLANSRLRGNNHKKVYSMTVNVLKNYNYIQKIINEIQLLDKEKQLRREIASILIYELIFGRGFLPGENKVIKIIQQYENEIFKAHEALQNTLEDSCLAIDLNIPRYVRVHTLVTTVSYVIKDLTSFGFVQVFYDNDLSEEKYLELVKNLQKGSFLIDFHFKDVLVFEHHENLVSLDLYKNGHIFLQDKSSYIPVHVLNPEPGCAVLDACAAPGMKTVHMAAKMKNKGLLIACERDKSRFESLKEMLDCGSVKICKTLCKDFKLIDPCDQAYSTIDYILLDPSCSGSGMVNRMDEVTDTENSKNMERLTKLAGFQIILLKHSLKFPSVKRVVYSTCSIHEEENEYVVHEALKAFNGTFKLIPAMPEWSHRGLETFEFGEMCLRTDPKVHLTNGFFVAVFERIEIGEYAEKYQDNYQNYYEQSSCSGLKKQKRKFSKPEEGLEMAATENDDNVNLKDICGIARSLEAQQMNDGGNFELLNKNNESLENFTINENYEWEQNSETQQINKKYKKKKKEKLKECSYELASKRKKQLDNSFSKTNDITNSDTGIERSKQNEYQSNEKTVTKNYADVNLKHNCNTAQSPENCKTIENSSQDINSQLRHNLEYSQQIKKKHKKKKTSRECSYESNEFEILNESGTKCSKLKKHFNISFPEDDCNTNIGMRNDKSIQSEHQVERSLYENSEVTEKFTEATKLHKKNKKKKKEHFEITMLQPEPVQKYLIESDKLTQEQPNAFPKQKASKFKKNENILQAEQDREHASCHTSYDESEKLINMTSSHKKKKNKYSDMDNVQSCKKMKESDASLSYALGDEINQHHSVENMSESNQTSEELVVLTTLLHKIKKKKKNKDKINQHQSVENMYGNNETSEDLDLTLLHKKKKKKKNRDISLQKEV